MKSCFCALGDGAGVANSNSFDLEGVSSRRKGLKERGALRMARSRRKEDAKGGSGGDGG